MRFSECFWLWSERLANIMGLLTLPFILALFTWVQKRIKRKKSGSIVNSPVEQTGVLVVNISTANIENEVKSYLRTTYPELKLKKKSHIVDVPGYFRYFCPFERIDSPEKDISRFRELLVNEIDALQDHNIQHIHLVVRGPMMIPLIIGDELANNKRVTFHHKNGDQYECWGDV